MGQQQFAHIPGKTHQKALQVKTLVEHVLNAREHSSSITRLDGIPEAYKERPIDQLEVLANQVVGQGSALGKRRDAVKDGQRVAERAVGLFCDGMQRFGIGREPLLLGHPG